jgi:hypothetical protein
MPKIHITHETEKNAKEIVAWLEENLANILHYKIKQDRFKHIWDETQRILTITGRMVKGSMIVENQLLQCDIVIPLLLRPFLPTIELAVKDTLKKL